MLSRNVHAMVQDFAHQAGAHTGTSPELVGRAMRASMGRNAAALAADCGVNGGSDYQLGQWAIDIVKGKYLGHANSIGARTPWGAGGRPGALDVFGHPLRDLYTIAEFNNVNPAVDFAVTAPTSGTVSEQYKNCLLWWVPDDNARVADIAGFSNVRVGSEFTLGEVDFFPSSIGANSNRDPSIINSGLFVDDLRTNVRMTIVHRAGVAATYNAKLVAFAVRTSGEYAPDVPNWSDRAVRKMWAKQAWAAYAGRRS